MGTLADLARTLNFSYRRQHPGSHAPSLILLTDRHRVPGPEAAIRRLPPGSLVIYRDYDTMDRPARARALAKLCRTRRLRLLIAGDFELAVTLRVGLHLPEHLARNCPARIRLRHRRNTLPLTTAAHGRLALTRGVKLAVDGLLLSPVFATASHPGGSWLGLLAFRRLIRSVKVPVYALGGVSPHNARSLTSSGAAGLAGISGL